MIDAVERPALTSADVEAILAVPAVEALVSKTGTFVPTATRQQFIADLVSFSRNRTEGEGNFALQSVFDNRASVRALLATLSAEQPALRSRMLARLARYAPLSPPVAMTVHYVAGGLSDGFVLDDRPEPDLYVALDKASGDPVGVEQNMSHELYHSLQKASASRTPAARDFLASVAHQPPISRFLATTLWEGTANLAADARRMPAGGEYMKMWRERYDVQLAPAKLSASFADFGKTLAALQAGTMDFDAANRRGFYGGDNGSPYYFVGMIMAEALIAARGRNYVDEMFTRPPAQFFRDYLAVARARPDLPGFGAAAEAALLAQPSGW